MILSGVNIFDENFQEDFEFFDELGMTREGKCILPDFDLLTEMCNGVEGSVEEAGCSSMLEEQVKVPESSLDHPVNMEIEEQSIADIAVNSSDGSEFTHDEKTVAAVLASLETNSMTPLIKEGLRSRIQNKRLREGKGELEVNFVPYVKKGPQTEDEIKRAEIRKTQNKMAARRFRQRQKNVEEHLTKKIHRLESSNTSLRATLADLQQTKRELKELLENHLLICPNNEVTNQMFP